MVGQTSIIPATNPYSEAESLRISFSKANPSRLQSTARPVASLVALLATFLPAFILSGFIFDIGSMPTFIRGLTHLIAARYYVAILQTVFLAGDVWAVIVPNGLTLLFLTVILIGLVQRRTRKRLE